MSLYRGYARADLDRAYSPSSMVESLQPLLDRYAADSAAARATHPASRWSSERYGPAAAHTLDLFRPEAAPAPLLVFIHGGYWQALGKGDASFPAAGVTAAGFAYAALDYTLAPHARMTAIVEECRAALTFLWRERTRLGIDARGLVVSGHSAGAHLAAMTLVTDWAARGIDPAFIKGALLLGGVFDLEPIRQSYVNDALALTPQEAAENSPLLATPRVACPLVVTWAERDTHEFKRQSCDLASRWARQLPEVVSFEQTGVNHFDSLFEWTDGRSRLLRETVRLLRA